ncbi:MAG: AAA family ATPase [Mariniblastus sp.]|nr:AAA family ATPase [Mariniblastus sp.]
MNSSFSAFTHQYTTNDVPMPVITSSGGTVPLENRSSASEITPNLSNSTAPLQTHTDWLSAQDQKHTDNHFHGIPLDSFFTHPLAETDSTRPPTRIISESLGFDHQTPLSSIPSLPSRSYFDLGIHLPSVAKGLTPPTSAVHATRDIAFSNHSEPNPSFQWPAAVEEMNHHAAESVDSLGRTLLSMLGRGENRIGITSTRFGEGCSTITMTLAQWASHLGRSVLLVDGHPNRPDLSNQLNVETDNSWIQRVEETNSLETTIVSLVEHTVDFLPLKTEAPTIQWPRHVFDILGSMLQTVTHRYDLVLIDIGPAFQLMTELQRASNLVDIAVLTTAVDRTTIAERSRSQKQLANLGFQRVLVAENFAPQHTLEPGLTG